MGRPPVDRTLTVRQALVVKKNVRLLSLVRRAAALRTLAEAVGDDAESVATFGLMRAAQKFDPALGWRFSTYAVRCMRTALLQELCHMRAVRRFVPEGRTLISLDEFVDPHSDDRLHETIPAAGRRDLGLDYERRRECLAALRVLPLRMRRVVHRRMKGDTLDEVGVRMGLTRERVRQIQWLAHERLRRHFGVPAR